MQVDLELADRIALQAATLDAATHSLLTDVRAWDESGGWHHQGARSCADWLSWRVGWSSNTAREHVRIARKLSELPAIDDALRCGTLSYCKVRAITRVATAENESMLLLDAQLTTGAQLDKICRRYSAARRNIAQAHPEDDEQRRYLRRVDRDDGMVRIEAVLHPEEAALVWAAIETATRSLRASAEAPGPSGFERASGLVALAEAAMRGDRPTRSSIELVVTTTADALSAASPVDAIGVVADSTCLPAATVRRLACDAGIVKIVVDANGTALDVGRRMRTVNTALKRALERRDPTCRFPGCQNRLYLDAHHTVHWADGGETSISNLVMLCSRHHRFLHEYGYRVEMDVQQRPAFYTRRGKLVSEVPERPRPSAQLSIDVEVTPQTNACGWDGERLEYDRIVDGLLSTHPWE